MMIRIEGGLPAKLSPHFALYEFTRTNSSLPNQPGPDEECALRALCSAVLEPLRERLGVPIRITSGYRSPAVNAAAGGAGTSQHLLGEAADIVAVGVDRERTWAALRELVAGGLPVDQAIVYEASGHIHVSHTARHPARRQLLVRTMTGAYVSWRWWVERYGETL